MKREIKPGDFILIQDLGQYQIELVNPDSIYALSVSTPRHYLKVVPSGEKWVAEEHPEKELTFTSVSSLGYNLPLEIITLIGLKAELPDLLNMCRVNRKFNQLLCENESFWRERYQLNFGYVETITSNWKIEYLREHELRTMNQVFFFGDCYVLPGGKCITVPSQSYDVEARAGAFGSTFYILASLDYSIVWVKGYAPPVSSLGLGEIATVKRLTPIKGLRGFDVACGERHGVVLSPDGSIWVFGNNESGQLGLGSDIRKQDTPAKIPELKAKRIAAGANHTLVVDLEDNLIVFGDNGSGQLGLGDYVNRFLPANTGLKVKGVTAGLYFSLVIGVNDDVLGFGDNTFLQLGDTQDVTINRPTNLGIKGKFVAGGDAHSIIIGLDGSVWTSGVDERGELGRGKGAVGLGKVEDLTGKAAAGGETHTLIIGEDNRVFAFGSSVSTEIHGLKASKVIARGRRSMIIGKMVD